MQHTTKIQLGTETIMNIPLKEYNEGFTFIVNGKHFKTNRLIADLLSPNICKLHSIDPTVNTFTINTQEKGNFAYILDLIKFEQTEIPMNEVQFVSEVIENIGNISIKFIEKMKKIKITNDNVFSLIKRHIKYESFYSKELSDDIDYISSQFYELCITRREELKMLPLEVLLNIVCNDLLQLNDEDQLLSFINELYLRNSEYSIMYETVFFQNVSSKLMKEFIHIFKFNDMSKNIWHVISSRLENEDENNNNDSSKKCGRNEIISKRYERAQKQGMMFPVLPNKNLSGILQYLNSKTGGNIEDEVIITSSQCPNTSKNCPQNVILFGYDENYFHTFNEPNSWICFEFKNHRIIPTCYTIKSSYHDKGGNNPKDWVIEGSINNASWEIIDEQKNCPFLNGRYLVHTFEIQNQTSKEFKSIRMRQTGQNWYKDYCLSISSFEIYGRLIK